MIKFHLLIILQLSCICHLVSQTRDEIILYSDDYIEVVLDYKLDSDISDADWLTILFINKSRNKLYLQDAYYSINTVYERDGNEIKDYKALGSGNKYDLIHQYYDITDQKYPKDGISISPQDTLKAWKYLSNYAGVLLNSHNESKAFNQTAFFDLKFSYKNDTAIVKCESINRSINFNWTGSDHVKNEKLVDRLIFVINHPHYRWVNTYILDLLISIPNVVNEVSTDLILDGIINRRYSMTPKEKIKLLIELKNRNINSHPFLTAYYKRVLSSNYLNNVSRELEYYWDNELFDHLLLSDLKWRNIFTVLDINADDWSYDSQKTMSVFNYMSKQINFSYETCRNLDARTLARKIKMMSVCRDSLFIDFIETYFNRTDEYEITLTDTYSNYSSAFPNPLQKERAKVVVRLCDAAFIAWLKATGKIGYKWKHYSQTNQLKLTFVVPSKLFHNEKSSLNRNDPGMHSLDGRIRFSKENMEEVKN